MTGLELKVSADGPAGVTVISVEGEIDLGNADELGTALRSDEARGAAAVVLDLLGVAFMDSSGLRVLLLAHRELEPAFALALQPGSPVLRLLELAEVSGRMRIFPDLKAAIEGVRPGAPDAA